MNKIILKTFISSVAVIGLLAVSSVALADSVTGNLSTGLNANVGSSVNGVVVAPPIASPTAGVYDSAQSVTLTANGATGINYTTDGTNPTCTTGTAYSGQISVSSSEAIEAISCYPNNVSSTVASYLYAINPPSGGGGTSAPATGGGGGGGGSSGGGGSVSSTTWGISDFVLLMANWGQSGSGNLADFSGDSTVGIQDFVFLMANWGNTKI